MAIVLLEEILVGLEEARDSLEQAVAVLEDIIEEMSPDLDDGSLEELLEGDFRKPLKSRLGAIDELLEELAEGGVVEG
jgi:hypothetical protein